jgi:ATP-dependent Clp protease, protease subunit
MFNFFKRQPPTAAPESPFPIPQDDQAAALLEKRIVLIGDAIDEALANRVVASLLYLADQDPAAPIQLYINSSGGSLTAGMAIYDAMQHIPAPVATVCVGLASGIASLLLAAGTAGQRSALPHARIGLAPMTAPVRNAIHVTTAAKEIQTIEHLIVRLYVEHTGRQAERIKRYMSDTVFLDAETACAQGFIDRITPKPEI